MGVRTEANINADDLLQLVRSPSTVMVRNTPKGRAVFASSDIPASTIIEVSPVLIFPLSQLTLLKETLLDHYTYNWPLRSSIEKTQALALGLGSIFNHSSRKQNAGFKRDLEKEVIIYSTLRDVQSGEELCVSYGQDLWFEDFENLENRTVEELKERGETEEDILEAIKV